jgi:pimeloyl-ACP methyl ester carboxylesterase
MPPDFYSGWPNLFDYGFFSDAPPSPGLGFSGLSELSFGEEPFRAAGHSMGCLFALRLAALNPNVRALTLFAPFAKFGAEPEKIDAMSARLDENPRVLLKSFYRAVFAPAPSPLKVPETINIPALKAGLELLKNTDLGTELSKIKIPVLLIQGEKDAVSSPASAKLLKSLLSDTELRVIPATGHSAGVGESGGGTRF